MNPENVLKLVEAGFTAEEIRGMLKPQTPDSPASASLQPLSPETTGAAISEEAAPAEAPVQEADAVAQAVDKALSERLDQINSGFEQMYKNMQKLAGMPSMADIQPKGVEDIISNFFKEEN